jgi:hypothetical protein
MFGQLGLWAPSSGVPDVFTLVKYVFTYPVIEESGHPPYRHKEEMERKGKQRRRKRATAHDHNENKPVWPTWAVGVLSGVRDVEIYNCGRPS